MTEFATAGSKFESGDNLFFKFFDSSLLVGGIFLLGFTGILELTWPQQTRARHPHRALVIWLDRSSSSYLVTLTLMIVSMFSTFRYGYLENLPPTGILPRSRLGSGAVSTASSSVFLLFAEIYAFVILFLGYLQTLWPLRRTPVPLPDDPEPWPAVDLLIPTYNEPLSVVKYTALAAMNIDWPADKLNVYILDDGKRDEFRQLRRRGRHRLHDARR